MWFFSLYHIIFHFNNNFSRSFKISIIISLIININCTSLKMQLLRDYLVLSRRLMIVLSYHRDIKGWACFNVDTNMGRNIRVERLKESRETSMPYDGQHANLARDVFYCRDKRPHCHPPQFQPPVPMYRRNVTKCNLYFCALMDVFLPSCHVLRARRSSQRLADCVFFTVAEEKKRDKRVVDSCTSLYYEKRWWQCDLLAIFVRFLSMIIPRITSLCNRLTRFHCNHCWKNKEITIKSTVS